MIMLHLAASALGLVALAATVATWRAHRRERICDPNFVGLWRRQDQVVLELPRVWDEFDRIRAAWEAAAR